MLAYAVVMVEERLALRKSTPMILAAGAIWAVIALAYGQTPAVAEVISALQLALIDYAQLLLFLIAAMTYVNALSERNLFSALSAWLIDHGYGYRVAFWTTGTLAFALSPFIDNLTTALVLGAVVIAVGADSPRFKALACVNIVVAANAGGAFSPFGDITTLMVWQSGHLGFTDFPALFLPSAVSFLIPGMALQLALPRGVPEPQHGKVQLKRGAWIVALLFLATLASAVAMHQQLDLPPFLGMMTGLGYLQLYGYLAQRRTRNLYREVVPAHFSPLDVFHQMSRVEWDTLLFFYGVIICVEGLGFIGYMNLISLGLYSQWGATTANIAVGLLSGIVDNIPIMVGVLEINPAMPPHQWLLITLTTGIGGSLFSIGSAAGVALMGQAKGVYTFKSHLRWTPVVALGFFAAVALHLWLSG